MRVDIDIDPNDYVDADHVSRQIAQDAFDMLKSGQADIARAILASFLGLEREARNADPETARREKMVSLYREWSTLTPESRGDFWGWSHGKRKCS